jgi:chondroitin AC lyase
LNQKFSKIKLIFILVISLGCQKLSSAEQYEDLTPLNKILNRYRTLIHPKNSVSENDVEKYIKTLSDSGSWPDINYKNQSRAGWQPVIHLSRIKEMVLSLVEREEKGATQKAVESAVFRALDFWFRHRFQSTNWWFNEIGVPQIMRDIIILLDSRLNGHFKQEAITILAQHRVRGSAANRMWSAELAMHHGILVQSMEQLREAANTIWSEIQIGGEQGIQKDWSFFQHGARLQTFHYGKAYLDVVAKISWQLRETPWAIPQHKCTIITQYLLNGPQWMSRGIYNSPGTIDRQVSRRNSLRAADLRNILQLWMEVDTTYQKEIKSFLNSQEGQEIPPLGYRHFPEADFTTYHTPEGSIFLKTISSRTLFTESINNENLKGVPYLNCGDLYIIKNGKEYEGLQPVWKWNQLPGLTLPQKESSQIRMEFVGGIGAGNMGMTVMDYVRNTDDSQFRIKKLWAFYRDMMICILVSWVVPDSMGILATSVEQCRIQGEVEVASEVSRIDKLAEGNYFYENVRWVLHNGIGYIPLIKTKIIINLEKASGSWFNINRQYSQVSVEEPLFSLTMEHGEKPQPAGYIVVLGANRNRLEELTTHPTWKILQNNQNCQSISFDNRIHMAGFYVPSAGTPEMDLKVNKPSLGIWSDNELWLCDPTHLGMDISVIWKKQEFLLSLPNNGSAEHLIRGKIN